MSSDITEQAAKHNQHAWNSFRRQRDEGLVKNRHDPAADILQGKSYLAPEMIALAGDVSGKRLLDMFASLTDAFGLRGCGDGAEMLEWARLGATVVGVDNSPRQLEATQRNADKLGLSCRLILADLLRLPDDLLNGQFDIVFSFWVTAWIGDLERWFRNVFLALKPGGFFLLGGKHPVAAFFQDIEKGESFRNSYFSEGPFIFDICEEPDETDSWNPAGDLLTTTEWCHTLGSIVTAIAQSDLRVSHLLELPDREGKRPERPDWFILRAIKDVRV